MYIIFIRSRGCHKLLHYKNILIFSNNSRGGCNCNGRSRSQGGKGGQVHGVAGDSGVLEEVAEAADDAVLEGGVQPGDGGGGEGLELDEKLVGIPEKAGDISTVARPSGFGEVLGLAQDVHDGTPHVLGHHGGVGRQGRDGGLNGRYLDFFYRLSFIDLPSKRAHLAQFG